MWNISLNIETETSKDMFQFGANIFWEMWCYYKTILWLEASYFSFSTSQHKKMYCMWWCPIKFAMGFWNIIRANLLSPLATLRVKSSSNDHQRELWKAASNQKVWRLIFKFTKRMTFTFGDKFRRLWYKHLQIVSIHLQFYQSIFSKLLRNQSLGKGQEQTHTIPSHRGPI